MFLSRSLVLWKCKKQTTISKSSVEAEYKSMSTATIKIILLQSLLAELRIHQCGTTTHYVDNIRDIRIVLNLMFHERSKHKVFNCHFIIQHFVSYYISPPHRFRTSIGRLIHKDYDRSRHDFPNSKLMLRSTSHQFEGECREHLGQTSQTRGPQAQ